MKAKTILIALVAGFLLSYSAVSPQEAEASTNCTDHWHQGWAHTHPTWKHWHTGYNHQHCTYGTGEHPYTLSLANQYSDVYLPWRGYVWNEFALIAKWAGWKDWQIPKLWRVSTCESGRRWWAMSSSGTYVGLMQNRVGNGGMSENQLKNPVLNLIVSRWLFEDRGWQPWPVCGSS